MCDDEGHDITAKAHSKCTGATRHTHASTHAPISAQPAAFKKRDCVGRRMRLQPRARNVVKRLSRANTPSRRRSRSAAPHPVLAWTGFPTIGTAPATAATRASRRLGSPLPHLQVLRTAQSKACICGRVSSRVGIQAVHLHAVQACVVRRRIGARRRRRCGGRVNCSRTCGCVIALALEVPV